MTKRNNKMTKKSVIRRLLLEEIKSEEMQNRITALGYDVKMKWDLLVDDESRIKFIDELRKTNKKIRRYKGRNDMMFLTIRGYILLMAYKKSFSEIKDMRKLFKNRLEACNEAYLQRSAWYYELIRNCEFLGNEIFDEIHK